MWQLSDRLLFHALCLQPGGSGLVLSVLVPRELRRPSQKATVLRKVFNVQHSGSKESHLFENIKDHHGSSCFFYTSACSAFFSISVEENWCKSNGHLSVLKDAFHSSMLVYSLANKNITRVPQTLPLCPVEVQKKIYMLQSNLYGLRYLHRDFYHFLLKQLITIKVCMKWHHNTIYLHKLIYFHVKHYVCGK